MAVAESASTSFIAIAVGTGVLLDVLIFCKTVFQNAKGVIALISGLLKDALRRQEERRKKEERRQAEIERLRQENEELKKELKRRPPSS